MKKQYIFLFLATFFLHIITFAQVEEIYPNEMTSEERALIDNSYLPAMSLNAIVTPPTSPVRAAAEWEEVQTLFITWTSFPAILREIIKNAQQECQVVVVCTDSNTVKSNLSSNNIPMTNVGFLQKPFNTIWMRDYGGNTVYENGVEDRLFVDWIYNRPRPKDDTIPAAIATMYNIPHYSTTTPPNDLVGTGGNFMSDGRGTAFSSKLILNENQGTGFSPSAKTEPQVDSIMHRFLGIDYGRYIKMETLPYDGIHHIDMHMKLLDEETLLVGEYPQGVADGPQIEANLQYVLANYNSVFGTPYKVVRIPQPPENGAYPNTIGAYRTYANWIFVNKMILLPIYETQYDTTALRILQENLPNYNIVGIPCNDIIQQSGAIHCITHTLGVDNPLLISHQALDDTYNSTTPYYVTALITHRTGISAANVMYRLNNTGNFMAAAMTNTGQNMWTADIPAQNVGTEIQYYIDATATSGKQQVRPITAPNGFWDFKVLGGVATENGINESAMMPIFPNPASALTCIPVKMDKPIAASIEMYDMLGKKVQTIFEGTIPAGESKYFFFANKLTAGIYNVVLQTTNNRYGQRVVVK